MTIPRPEHPKPQFFRDDWINLNGTWTYAFDFGKSGMNRELYKSTGFDDKITVPFCPESKLSGVGHTDFIEAMWYHRTIKVPEKWAGKRILLHFGGVDYESELFIDGKSVGLHYGGMCSFKHDITDYVKGVGEHSLVLRVLDELRTGAQAGGKQSGEFKSQGCHYTRTTGIWQTVWLEAVDLSGLESVQVVPDLDNELFTVVPQFYGLKNGQSLKITVKDEGKAVTESISKAGQGIPVSVKVPKPKSWSPESPFLYDLVFEVLDNDGKVIDSVQSYAGMRKIHIVGDLVYLNNQPIYQRLVLDQGFYPDCIWTAPSDQALKRDIELSMQAGFNGARLHQKVFEERFHYWADKLGYLTWGESASWGCDVNKIEDARNFISEWRECLLRDRNHPSIIAWTPLNETANHSNPANHRRFHIELYDMTKALDPTRPVNDASGYIHIKTDLWTVHHYERPDKLAECLEPETEDGIFHRWPEQEVKYSGQPYLVDEFGGLKWIPEDRQAFADNTWGYGSEIKTLEEFYGILKDEVDIILNVKNMCGYCYTQLTDVEQEENGIYNYDRSEKFDMAEIKGIFGKNPGE